LTRSLYCAMSDHQGVMSLPVISRNNAEHYAWGTEEGVDEMALPDRVTFRQPPNLSFSNHMHRFITSDRSPG